MWGQHHICGRKFGGLTGPLHRNLLAEILDRLVGHGRRDERRPDWTRGDRIRANAFVREDLRQPGREILDRPFGRLAGTIDDGADLPIRFTWRLK
jgi:hypothetical protein